MTKEQLLERIYFIEDAIALHREEYTVSRDAMMRLMTSIAREIARLE